MEVLITKLRKIGNSTGILLSKNFLKHLHVEEDDNMLVKMEGNKIIIEAAPKDNASLLDWGKQFEKLSKKDRILLREENDFMEVANRFEEEEWTW